MIVSATQLPQATPITCDIAIVGAGPAGLTLCQELRDRGLSVVVLEAGPELPQHPEDMPACIGPGGFSYHVGRARARGLGGSSGKWLQGGWQAHPLSAYDLERRQAAGAAAVQWPLSHEDVARYFQRAHEICELVPIDYDHDAVALLDPRRFPALTRKHHDLVVTAMQLGDPGVFQRLGNNLSTASDIRIVLDARVTQLNPAASEGDVWSMDHLVFQAPDGRAHEVRAKRFVLAAGGIDNARLLLASKLAPLANRHDHVGRHFMEHLHGRASRLLIDDPQLLDNVGFFVSHQTERHGRLRGALRLDDAIMRKHRLNNMLVWLAPVSRVRATRSFTAYEELERCRRGQIATPPGFRTRNAANVLAGLPRAAWEVARHIRRKPRRPEAIRVYFEAEQAPHPASRVRLSSEKDRFGVPTAVLDWRVTEDDMRSVATTLRLVDANLRQLGLGRLEQDYEDLSPRARIGGGNHHMGTTRMAEHARDGVVDRDCRVFGVPNLLVAGSSVFPTGGAANPTLTIVALSVRLAEQLRSTLAS